MFPHADPFFGKQYQMAVSDLASQIFTNPRPAVVDGEVILGQNYRHAGPPLANVQRTSSARLQPQVSRMAGQHVEALMGLQAVSVQRDAGRFRAVLPDTVGPDRGFGSSSNLRR